MDLGGRPPHFESPEELSAKIQEYFNSCDSGQMPPDDEHLEGWTKLGEPITVTGLAYFLGFESRQSLYDYEKRDGFSYIIKKAKLKIESEYEKNLYGRNPTGSIFALKNMGWSDKLDVDQKSTIKDERIDASKLTDEELRSLAEIQRKSRASEA